MNKTAACFVQNLMVSVKLPEQFYTVLQLSVRLWKDLEGNLRFHDFIGLTKNIWNRVSLSSLLSGKEQVDFVLQESKNSFLERHEHNKFP